MKDEQMKRGNNDQDEALRENIKIKHSVQERAGYRITEEKTILKNHSNKKFKDTWATNLNKTILS